MTSGGTRRSRQLHFGVQAKLALVMFVFLLMWAGHFGISRIGQLDLQRFATSLDDAGRVRMLSQRIVHLGASPAPERVDALALGQALQDQSRTLARLGQLGTSIWLLSDQRGIDTLLRRLGQLDGQYRQAAGALLAADSDSRALQLAQERLRELAPQLLVTSEQLVESMLQAQMRAETRLDNTTNTLYLAGLSLFVLLAVLLHRQAVTPLRELAALARRAAAGDHSGRSHFRSTDELGELAQAFNLGNENTERLIARLEAESLALRRKEAKYRHLLESAADGIIIADHRGLIQLVNQQVETLFGYRREELMGQPIDILVPDRYRGEHRALREGYQRQPVRRPMGSGINVMGQRGDGSELPLEISLSPGRVEDERVVIAVVRDISERRAAEAARAQLTAIIDATTDVVAIFTPALELRHLNPAGCRLLGLPPQGELSEQNWESFLPTWSREIFRNEGLPRAVASGSWNGELALLDGAAREVPVSMLLIAHHDEAGTLEYVSCIGRDISERKRYEIELQHQATHDQLTGLANRTLFLDRLEQALHHAHRHQRMAGVLFIDLDNFKLVNDSLGHAAGDLLLRTIAQRLTLALREGDTVARHGGDEFTVVLDDLAQAEDAIRVVRGLMSAIGEPLRLGGQEITCTASIGVSLYPQDAADADGLMMNADAAMYRAKAQGRNRYSFYTANLNKEASQRLEVENGLRRALEREELLLHYQPLVDAMSGQIVGAEALLRWRHPEQGLVPPGGFIPVAEETGQIVAIGEWVLREACRQAQAWRAAGLPALRIAVNVSARQCRDNSLAVAVEQALRDSGLPAELLELELTESAIMESPAVVKSLLDRIRALGVRLVIDDFGTGYSSLSQLKLFHFDKVKVDRSFVEDICTDPSDAVIAEAVIGMAHTLGAKVVGEGVETEAQAACLRRYRCDQLQGYLFSRPLESEAFAALLGRHTAPLSLAAD